MSQSSERGEEGDKGGLSFERDVGRTKGKAVSGGTLVTSLLCNRVKLKKYIYIDILVLDSMFTDNIN